jgi:hypothetical protein
MMEHCVTTLIKRLTSPRAGLSQTPANGKKMRKATDGVSDHRHRRLTIRAMTIGVVRIRRGRLPLCHGGMAGF